MPLSLRDACPECGSPLCKQKGHSHTGQQNHQGKDGGRQFVVEAAHRGIDAEHRTVVERLPCEKISLPGICRAIGVRMRWPMDCRVSCFAAVPEHLQGQLVAASRDGLSGCLEGKAEELWSFGQKKTTPPWVWRAMAQQTRQLSAFHGGDRSQNRAKQLWANLPEGSREQAPFSLRISMQLTPAGVPPPNIKPSASTPAKLTPSRGATTPSGSGSHGWCAARWPSPRRWSLISVPSAISSLITISQEQHYLYNTTLSAERRGRRAG
jgi:hypothetical protein